MVNGGEAKALFHWPILIKYADYEELGYVDSPANWEAEVGVDGAYLNINDILIDSSGVAFSVMAQGEQNQLSRVPNAISIDQVLDWVRAHASMQGHCCVAKLSASSIAEVFTIIKSLDD